MTTKQVLTATVLLMIGLLAGCSKETVKQKPAKPVKVKAVETHSALSDVRYSASIKPAAQVEVSFKVGGYIDDIAREIDQAGQWRYIQAGDVVQGRNTRARASE